MILTCPADRGNLTSYYPRMVVFLSGILFITILMNAPRARGQQVSAPTVSRLSKIEVSGLQRYSEEEVITASGLQLGQNVDVAALKAAVDQLMKTGLFKNIRYRYLTFGDQAEVSFQVEEEKWRGPVVFDNFIWFSDEEILRAIRQELPRFDGLAPEAGVVIDGIKRVLERLLQERKIPGHVEHMPFGRPVGSIVTMDGHLFKARDLHLLICDLRFPGATVVKEGKLVRDSKPLISKEYSRRLVMDFINVSFVPIYRQRGHLRVRFFSPVAKLEPTSKCKEGVAVTLPVEEGPAYFWDRAEGVGNEAISQKDLDKLLGMKSGKLADGLKIDAGLNAVWRAYRKKGFMEAKLSAEAHFDDVNRRVSYRITITEGPQRHK